LVHDEAKDKEFELELTWICPESKGKHQKVPNEVKVEAERLAKASLDDEMEQD
jgi:20S proteasome subunit alpha 7